MEDICDQLGWLRAKVSPHKHQIDGFKFLVGRREGMLAYAPGTGKTFIGYATGIILLKKKLCEKVLFIGPPSSCIELEDDGRDLTTAEPFILDSEIESMEEFYAGDNPFGILTNTGVKKLLGVGTGETAFINVDSLIRVKKLFQEKKTCVIIDEFHFLMNPQSMISQCFRVLKPHFEFTYGLTGTPISKDIHDIYHLCEFLRKGVFGSIKEFDKEFTITELEELYYRKMTPQELAILRNGGYEGKRKPNVRMIPVVKGFRNLEALKERVRPLMLDYFPPSDVRFYPVKYELQNMDRYMQIAGQLGKKGLDGEKISASSLVAQLTRYVGQDENKQEELRKLIRKDIEKGVLIFTFYRECETEIANLVEEMGYEYRSITGSTNKKRRREIKKWFNDDPNGKVLCLTSAGGQSLNLQSTNTFIFYDIPKGVGQFIQVIGRMVRMNSKYEYFDTYFLMGKECIDEYKYEMLSANRQLVLKVMGNSIVPESIRMPNFDADVIKMLKKKLLWKKGR